MAFGEVEHTDFKILRPLDQYSPKASVSHLSESCGIALGEGNGMGPPSHEDCRIKAFLHQGSSTESPGKRCGNLIPACFPLHSSCQHTDHVPHKVGLSWCLKI